MAGKHAAAPLLALALLVGAPCAAAGSLALETSAPVEIDGELVAAFPAGQLTMIHPPLRGQSVLTGLTGTLTMYEWEAVRARGGGEAMFPVSDARVRAFDLRDATLVVRFSGENLGFAALAHEDGALLARARIDATGEPARVPATATASSVSVPAPWAFDAAPDLEPAWEEGWAFAGRYRIGSQAVEGLPAAEATLDMRGAVLWKLHGGTVRFVDAQGATHELWTGDRTLLGHGENGTQQWRRLLFDGAIESAAIPLGGAWGLAGPSMSWSVQGDVAWRDASGWVEDDDGRRVAFEEARVEMRGDLLLSPLADDGLLGGATRYDGTGTLQEVRVDGSPVLRAAGPAPTPAVGFLAVVAAYGGLGRLVATLYTRLTRTDLVEHPARSRILEIVREEPGIHLRELQRRLGGAWGPFTFHLRMLEREGIVQVEKDGRYRAAYLAGARSEERPIHHPLAKRIFEALPEDGAPRTLGDVAQAVGASRPLVYYHVRKLADHGRVAMMGVGAVRGAARLKR